MKLEKTVKKTGELKKEWGSPSYHANFKQALKWMVRNRIQTSDDLKMIVERCDKLEKLIDSLKLKDK